jgi:hypothetical protein
MPHDPPAARFREPVAFVYVDHSLHRGCTRISVGLSLTNEVIADRTVNCLYFLPIFRVIPARLREYFSRQTRSPDRILIREFICPGHNLLQINVQGTTLASFLLKLDLPGIE